MRLARYVAQNRRLRRTVLILTCAINCSREYSMRRPKAEPRAQRSEGVWGGNSPEPRSVRRSRDEHQTICCPHRRV